MNIWILTEERPKHEVIGAIINKFAADKDIQCFFNAIQIIPILDKFGNFTFVYEIIGVNSQIVNNIYLKIVSGKSSFVDFLVFYQQNEPISTDIPIYAIEETKTDDAESRNTGVYQRATKFVYIEFFYPNINKTMLYNLKITQKQDPTPTNIFGSRCFRTLGVEFSGKKFDEQLDSPWKSIDEMISYKDGMKKPPASNVPIEIKKYENKITVSGRLFKSDSLSHDPNIGALSLICASLRKLGWTKKIEIIKHGLEQRHLSGTNKFVLVANRLGVTFEGLILPNPSLHDNYWYIEKNSEKLGTIFIHVAVENFTNSTSIYENHAGCERGYFITKLGDHISVDKKIPENAIRDKSSRNVEIPDLVLIDLDRKEIINIEGKTYKNVNQGIIELENFDAIEKYYINKYYPEYSIIRTVVLYGGDSELADNRVEVSFLLNSNGKIILGTNAPNIFKDAIYNLFAHWGLIS
jgi:hypothetical protein